MELFISFHQFDVKAILNGKFNDQRGKAIMESLESGRLLADPDRKLVMRILSKWLHNEYVK